MLQERHPARANGVLALFVPIDQGDALARTREDDPERQPDVPAATDDDDIVAIHARIVSPRLSTRRHRFG